MFSAQILRADAEQRLIIYLHYDVSDTIRYDKKILKTCLKNYRRVARIVTRPKHKIDEIIVIKK